MPAALPFPSSPSLALIGAPWQMVVILVVVLLLFGSRLPSLMRSLGSSVNEFKKGIKQGTEDENGDSQKT
jgi:sec-independent protein translocase protein TatA